MEQNLNQSPPPLHCRNNFVFISVYSFNLHIQFLYLSVECQVIVSNKILMNLFNLNVAERVETVHLRLSK